jgi:hypothetical protein
LQAGGVAAESLKTGIADGNGSPRTIKLELHRIVLDEVMSPARENAGRYLVNNFFFAAASSLSFPSSTLG